ncbi:unnamed protein product [Oikopleura dioica]|uniref:Rab-GAP TBC domain-containing protein n=1 Tax=Oikopleura dioica TaxID=34765 RepID=E4WXH0_OIKDI|nr:unnamed protein product [Oikopleura dioica]
MDAGLPSSWRKKIWLGLAQDYFQEVNLDRENLFPSLFNSTLTDDDKHLDYQIVKDLHRTANIGSRHDQQRLKRILLAYARYNPECGYCQGFNVIVALIMEVMESESDTLQVFIFMLHAVLPPEYHSHNLEGIQTDLKVLSDLMKTFTPKVNSHLINLRESSIRENGHEPPLASPYMMQWLLTAFGTFFPKKIVYRLWDGLLIDGNEILIRGILATWKCKEEDLLAIDSTDMFYQFMSRMVNTQSEEFICEKEFFKTIYSITAFPMKNLFSLRKKHRSGTLIQKSVPNSPVEEQGQIMKPKSSFSWWPTFGYTPVPRSTSFSTPLHSPDSPTEGDESPTKIQEKTLSKSTTSVKDEKPSINPRELEKQEIDKLYKNFNNARKPKIGINLFSRPSSSPIESIEKRTVFNHLCQSHQKISVKEQKSSFNRTKFTLLISSSSDSE